MKRSELVQKRNQMLSRFSAFTRSQPERSFFYGMLLGALVVTLLSVVVPLVLTGLVLFLVYWLLADGEGEATPQTVHAPAATVTNLPSAEAVAAPRPTMVPLKQSEHRPNVATRERGETAASSGYKPPRPLAALRRPEASVKRTIQTTQAGEDLSSRRDEVLQPVKKAGNSTKGKRAESKEIVDEAAKSRRSGAAKQKAGSKRAASGRRQSSRTKAAAVEKKAPTKRKA